MAKLTDEERQFRKEGAGIPFSRWWPMLVMLIAIFAAFFDGFLFPECLGADLPPLEGKAALVEIALVFPCSPFLLKGGWLEWILFAALWVPAPFAVINWRWASRQRAYWDRVRAREAENRKRRRSEKAQQEEILKGTPLDE